jgi:hypothetical protein
MRLFEQIQSQRFLEPVMKEVKLWNRRDFVTRPVAALAASTLLSGSEALFAQSPSPDKNAPVLHRTLGKTGISIPIVHMIHL